MDGTIYLHDLDFYKSVGNCLITSFIDLRSTEFGPNNSNSNTDERTDSNRKGMYRLSDLVNKIKQKQREIDNYNKIEKEYYL